MTYRFLLMLLLTIPVFTACQSKTDSIDKPNAVTDLLPVEIGGLEQWLLIRGEDTGNPILLWLHGGPGAAQMPIHHAYTSDLEKDFIVVHWDQRGAGKSNHEDFWEESMTVSRFVEDVHEATQYLKQRFDREKILLLGHSWGTQIGILAASKYPEDYAAFISVGQVVHPQRGDSLSYNWLMKTVREKGSEKQKDQFKTLGRPPFEEHDTYVAFARMKDDFGGGMDVDMGSLLWKAIGSKEYTLVDYIKWFRGANRGSGPMWEESRAFNLFDEVPVLRIPVQFIVGEHDYNTPAELVQEYYYYLEAPEKDLVVMEECAHAPFIGDPEKFNHEVLKVKQKYFSESYLNKLEFELANE